jgi:hypothetical protein
MLLQTSYLTDQVIQNTHTFYVHDALDRAFDDFSF